jgi:ABC-2 type transport system ATP-binding protein
MSTPPALRIHDLCKTYAGGNQALRGVSLCVESGDFFALLGPNGAGKSTLIGIVSALVNSSAGSVEVFGVDAASRPSLAKTFIGVVPQEVNFNPWEPPLEVVVTQAGYYGIPRATALPRAEELLRLLKLWDHHGQPARQLSGGMKRRLMIARSLVHRPRLLILDEPTAGVDIEIRRSMWEFLRDLNAGGTTIILTTHYLEEAENLCRNIAIIDDGEIVESTSMRTLLARLQVETFVLDLGAEVAPDFRLPGHDTRRVDSHTLEVDVSKDRGINALFAALSERGIEVMSMRNKANRLEELFLRLIDENDREPAPFPVVPAMEA